MKLITMLGLVLGGVYFYTNASTPIEVQSYEDLLSKVEITPVTVAEVKRGANHLAIVLCKDASLQETAGRSPKQCLKTYGNMREMCEQRIFTDDAHQIDSKDRVMQISRRYTACVNFS